ncbi:SPFH domain-containing protein [Streptomyces sp. NBC_00536]|uniref:SPFH domain-containing protein n=1 Tax=Streptomyces sp. NBC_00536 TaxID=2975769 RepID=UPI002E803649|nr:SPFH domain-containing protein [Streptomyces sp. NBC_00536]WUC79236.1 SPFH domain-containing protein [Streptomyces sp. NBC_00536]
MYPTRTTSTTGTMRIPPTPPPAPPRAEGRWTMPPAAPHAAHPPAEPSPQADPLAPDPRSPAAYAVGSVTPAPEAPRPVRVPEPSTPEADGIADRPAWAEAAVRSAAAAAPQADAHRPAWAAKPYRHDFASEPEVLTGASAPEAHGHAHAAMADPGRARPATTTAPWPHPEPGDPTRGEVPAARGVTDIETEPTPEAEADPGTDPGPIPSPPNPAPPAFEAPPEAVPAGLGPAPTGGYPRPAMAVLGGPVSGLGPGTGPGPDPAPPAFEAPPEAGPGSGFDPVPVGGSPRPVPAAFGGSGAGANSAPPAFEAPPEAGPGPGLDPAPATPAPAPGVWPPAPGSRREAPRPGVALVVAQAVARGMEEDTQDLPRVNLPAPGAGESATAVPTGLPFQGEGMGEGPGVTRPAPRPRPKTAPPTPGRRVPRGDDRLRERHGPVLPGSVGLLVGGLALAGCAAVLWRAGALPAALVEGFGVTPRAYQGLRAYQWPPLAFLGIVALFALGGLGRGRTGHAWVLTLFGRYRGTVRRTGLLWVSPLLLRRRVDVRLRHWRSEPLPAVDSGGLALQVVVQVVWQIKDTARAALAVEDHIDYLAEQVESAMARVLSQLPADAFHEDAPTLRDAEAVGDALTRMLAAETEAVGIEVYSAQPTRIEYAPEVAAAMRRRRVAAIDAKHRDSVLTSVVDAVDDTVNRLTSRGLVELDDYERKALVKDLTVAFYTGRPE